MKCSKPPVSRGQGEYNKPRPQLAYKNYTTIRNKDENTGKH